MRRRWRSECCSIHVFLLKAKIYKHYRSLILKSHRPAPPAEGQEMAMIRHTALLVLQMRVLRVLELLLTLRRLAHRIHIDPSPCGRATIKAPAKHRAQCTARAAILKPRVHDRTVVRT